MLNCKFLIRKKSMQIQKFYSNKSLRKSFLTPCKSKIGSSFAVQIANNLTTKLLEAGQTTKKSLDRWITLTIPAGEANMQPPVGPFLGQHGLNAQLFCTTFNNLTKIIPNSVPIWVVMKLFTDKSIQFYFKTPPSSFLLFNSYLNNESNGVSLNDLIKILFLKKIDLSQPFSALTTMLLGSMWSMGIKLLKKN